ncbi:hypothetical protein MATL_G00077110 [Megalops atlanticus]|uniref:Uncharacterized protein n=1 Tax=Megalops atlanticus TaxID=7932 RepID=A0A9D3Q6A9_MEGAT|nr:hypothetical protein MATL_G00077110 [Megalops atlanticus]
MTSEVASQRLRAAPKRTRCLVIMAEKITNSSPPQQHPVTDHPLIVWLSDTQLQKFPRQASAYPKLQPHLFKAFISSAAEQTHTVTQPLAVPENLGKSGNIWLCTLPANHWFLHFQ